MKFGSVMALLLAGCATLKPADHIAPGTAPAPAEPWTPPPSLAQPAPVPHTAAPAGYTPGMKVTLPQVIDIALSNNPATRKAWLEARAAEAAVGSRRGTYWPELDLNASYNRTHQATQGGKTIFNSTTYGPSLALSYLIYDFGGRAAQVDEARETLIAADFAHNEAIQDVILQTERAYYGYLDAKALLTAQDATLKERQAELDAAEARHSAGVATIADVLQAKTALSQAQLTYESYEGSVRTIEGALATAMGLPATTRFDFGELPLELPAQRVSEAVDQLIQTAETQRPDLAASRALAERARSRIREIRAQGLPSITFNSTISRTTFGGAASTTATPYSAGVAMHWPLLTGWRNTYDVRQAEIEAQIADEDVVNLAQQIDLQVWTSYYTLQTATQRLTTSRDLLASAQESVNVARERYREGLGTILDELTAQAALESARAQEVQARADWLVSVAQLAHDTGKLEK